MLYNLPLQIHKIEGALWYKIPPLTPPSDRIYNQWGFGQCLPFSWTTLRGKHCRHPIALMGVVDTFGQYQIIDIPLRRPKRLIFLGQGPVQGPREEVQGPCARATHPENRNGCKGFLDMCKGLWCVQGPYLLSLYQNDKQYNLVQGPQLEFWKILMPLHLFSWPFHIALAPLLMALALALAPEKWAFLAV